MSGRALAPFFSDVLSFFSGLLPFLGGLLAAFLSGLLDVCTEFADQLRNHLHGFVYPIALVS